MAGVVRLTADACRRAPSEERLAAQEQSLGLPVLPTTTIGSFPQTRGIRTAERY